MKFTFIQPPSPYLKKLAKWRRYNRRHRLDKNRRNKARYHRRKIELQKEKHACACGCGELIPIMTVHNKPCIFKKGHATKFAVFTEAYRASKRKQLLLQFNDKEFQKKRMKGLMKRPTTPEKRLIRIIEQNSLPFRYVGDGEFFIGRANPDFVSTDGTNRVLEIFGDYWHKLENLLPISTEAGRKAIFMEMGYSCLILWESEMKKMSDSEIVSKILSLEVVSKSS